MNGDGFLERGEIVGALRAAGLGVSDEAKAIDWLDRDFDNRVSYKEFRAARKHSKHSKNCPMCQKGVDAESSNSDHEQEDLLRSYWKKFDPGRCGFVSADIVIDHICADWGIGIDPSQRDVEKQLMESDANGNITYRQFKRYFTAVPEDSLSRRLSSAGGASSVSIRKFERQLDAMLIDGSQAGDIER